MATGIIAGLVIAAAGTAAAAQQQRKGAKAGRAAAKEERDARRADAAVKRRQTIREARIRGAELENQALAVGAGGSSGLAGGGTALKTGAQVNLANINTQEFFNNRITKFRLDANKASSNAATAGAVANFGLSAASAAGSF